MLVVPPRERGSAFVTSLKQGEAASVALGATLNEKSTCYILH